MRSDVKVGMICAFALLLCIVGYFAWGGKSPQRTQAAPATVQPTGEVGQTPADPSASHSTILTDAPTITNTSVATGGPGLQDQINTNGRLGDDPPTGPTPGAPTLEGPTPGVTVPAPAVPAPSSSATMNVGHGTASGTTTAGETEYTVKHGDSIWTIARQFKVTREALMSANSLTTESKLSLKQVLKIPAGAVTPASSGTSSGATHAVTGSGATPAATGATKTYTVKANDSLRKIAKSVYGDEKQWTKIFAANKASLGGDANTLKVGQVLKIPA